MDTKVVHSSWSDLLAVRASAHDGGELAAILSLSGTRDLVNLSGGFPDPITYPTDLLARLASEAITEQPDIALQYAPTEGLAGLRSYLIERLNERDRLGISEESFLVTSGGIECLELIARTFLDRSDLVIVEGPTFFGAITAFFGYEADIVAVELESDGISIESLKGILEGGKRPKLLYLIPDHQNPTGQSMSDEKRVEVIALARRYGFLILEDVAYRDLSFDDERARSLLELGPECVIQIGTFSKTFSPGFRLGWAAGPPEIIAQLVRAKQNSDQCSGALGQLILEAYGRSGGLDETIIGARAFYRRRAQLMGDALAASMPTGVTWSKPSGGFFYWVTLPSHIDTTALKVQALAEGVAYVPGSPFYPTGAGRNELRLSYSRVKDAEIATGIERLAAIVATDSKGA